MEEHGLLRHMVVQVRDKGTITFTYVCDHCKSFFVEDFLWWVTANDNMLCALKPIRNFMKGNMLALSLKSLER